jgi:dTDP-4-dehydrorhamnose 3,5-epimerase
MTQVKIQKTRLDGVQLITPATMFEDFRGEYVELYNEKLYNEAGIDTKFVEDDISVSSHHVLRGIHGDQNTTKLVSCLHGKFYLVVLNNIEGHPQYRQWEAFTLSAKNRLQVLIPAGFGNGHVVLSDVAIFHYKQSSAYNRAGQFTLIWNDPALNIWWPIKAPLVSQRDETNAK